MKILHVLNTNKLSGAENVVADICMMLKGDYEMAYCSPDGIIKEALRDREVNFIPLNSMTASEIKRAIKEFKPDIIHSHDVRATVLAAWVSGKVPIVTHLHVNSEDMSNINFKSVLYMLASKKAKKVIVVSDSCLNEYIFKNTIQNKSVLLKNVIYSPRIEKLMDKDKNYYDFDFVFLGRLSHQKNPQKVARVAARVLTQYPSATFGIIGEGDLRQEMEDILKNEGVMDRVTFTGRLPYPYKALKQAKCMLMCSRFEGTPIAALEAMALGVPIVSTPVDGMLDIVVNQKTGFLSSDDMDLAEAVLKLLSDTRLQQEMSTASIKRFADLNQEKEYKQQLEEIYNRTINY